MIIDIPVAPPSANMLFRNTSERERAMMKARGQKARSRVKTPRYLQWKQAVGHHVNRQRTGKIAGRYTITIQVNPKASKADLGNLIKAVEDLLVDHEVIEDDSLQSECHLYWSDAVECCRVTVLSIEDAA